MLQLVTGDAEDAPAIGGELTSNPIVRKIGFTGSTEVGKLLMAQCAGRSRRSRSSSAATRRSSSSTTPTSTPPSTGAILCKFRNSGQTCIAANRILVQDGVHDEFVERFGAAVGALEGRQRHRPGVDVGPLIDERAVEKVERTSPTRAPRRRGRARRRPARGLFFEPTVLTGVTTRWR